jgi:hypothetical protein
MYFVALAIVIAAFALIMRIIHSPVWTGAEGGEGKRTACDFAGL